MDKIARHKILDRSRLFRERIVRADTTDFPQTDLNFERGHYLGPQENVPGDKHAGTGSGKSSIIMLQGPEDVLREDYHEKVSHFEGAEHDRRQNQPEGKEIYLTPPEYIDARFLRGIY